MFKCERNPAVVCDIFSISLTGVRVTGGRITVPPTTTLIEGLQNYLVERIDIFFDTHQSGAGASSAGEDLWTITV